jgi:RNA polymerase sigma-70 factor (family 1)
MMGKQMNQEDKKLVLHFQHDPGKAFRALFERYYKALYLAAFYYLHDDQEAEDVVQQIFVKFWEDKYYLQIQTSYKSYFYTAVRNACLNSLKKSQNQQKHPAGIEEEKVKLAIDFILDDEQQQIITQACQKIPDKSRAALELVYLQNYSYQKAAEKLGITINTLKSNLKLALKVLRDNKALQDYFLEKKSR